jgi:hypothetical protein
MPGVRVTSVRRTVVVAVALVTGQALLCGIIGFVTFGDHGGAPPGVRAAEPQLAGPPIVLPPSSAPTTGAPTARPTSGTPRPVRTERPTSPPAPTAARDSAPRKSTRPARTTSAPTPAAPEPPPVPAVTPTDQTLLPPAFPASPAPADDAPEPVVEKEPCDEAGATGTTVEGKPVRCERARDGELRWRLV